jgi:hypothetical protein
MTAVAGYGRVKAKERHIDDPLGLTSTVCANLDLQSVHQGR